MLHVTGIMLQKGIWEKEQGRIYKNEIIEGKMTKLSPPPPPLPNPIC